MTDQPVFNGEERLEAFRPTGRPMRMGAPRELAVSDKSRVEEALAAGDAQKAVAYLEFLWAGQSALTAGYAEWVLRLPAAFRDQFPGVDERVVTKGAYDLWLRETEGLKGDADASKTVDLLAWEFHPDRTSPDDIEKFQQELSEGKGGRLARILDGAARLHRAVLEEVRNGDFKKAASTFERYSCAIRLRHDLLMQYTSAYPTAVLRAMGQEAAERLAERSFSSCSFHDGLFELAVSLPPRDLAAFYADHLRSHFTGSGREGTVGIVEEKDRYRLVFDPCGSGGVMRQRLAREGDGIDKLPEATAKTWNRKGEVPAYCSHCATNELTYIRKVGYPAVVTEFDPNPERPCGWTIYKDPEKIPEQYFTRLGLKRDPSKFVRRYLQTATAGPSAREAT
jgi:hypothetical protein